MQHQKRCSKGEKTAFFIKVDTINGERARTTRGSEHGSQGIVYPTTRISTTTKVADKDTILVHVPSSFFAK